MRFILPLFLALPAFAADHIISWTANPTNESVLAYVIYEQSGTNWVRKLDVASPGTNGTLLNVTVGWHVYAVSATNVFGVGPMSMPVSAFVPTFPTPPTNVIVNLRASVDGITPGGTTEGIARYWLPVVSDKKNLMYRGKEQLDNTNIVTNIEASRLNGVWTNTYAIPSTTSKVYATATVKLLAVK